MYIRGDWICIIRESMCIRARHRGLNEDKQTSAQRRSGMPSARPHHERAIRIIIQMWYQPELQRTYRVNGGGGMPCERLCMAVCILVGVELVKPLTVMNGEIDSEADVRRLSKQQNLCDWYRSGINVCCWTMNYFYYKPNTPQ